MMQQRPDNPQNPSRRRRRGISLLEVLISIFVLAVGLLGVAALIPAGRHEIAHSSRLDTAAMVGRAAFRDLRIRGLLNPGDAAGNANWLAADGTQVWDPVGSTAAPFVIDGAATNQVAYVLDPLGIYAAGGPPGYGNIFPHVTTVSEPHLTRIGPAPGGVLAPQPWIDMIFRASVDRTTEENANADLPPVQFWFNDGTNPLRRASEGSYSWLATIVSDPTTSALAGKVTVSVVVFHKRNLSLVNPPGGPDGAGEYMAAVTLAGGTGRGVGGGELGFFQINSRPYKTVKPGDWVMLAGRRRVGPPPEDYHHFGWYRVVAAGRGTTAQRVTLSGADWDPTVISGGIGGANFTRAFIFDNVVAVYQKTFSLDVD